MTQPPNDEFFDQMREWSDRKLRILTGYLAGAVRILGSFSEVCYVDGFAGMGIYRDGSKGSPVRAAEMARQYKAEGKKYTFRCVNVEENKGYFDNLEKSTMEFGSEVLNLHGTFAENVDRILQEARGRAIIGFLDPFGIEGVDWTAVLKLINRPEPTDLWIRFDPLTARRLYGFLDEDPEKASSKPDTLSRVYGLSAAELLKLLDGPTPEERMKKAIKLYETRLASAFSKKSRKLGFAATYVVKSLEGDPKGHLVFAAAHPKAAVLMNDTVYAAEQNYKRDVAEYQASLPHQMGLFSTDPTPDQIFAEKVAKLADDIYKVCRGESIDRLGIFVRVFGEDPQFTRQWFGEISSKHMNAALNLMRKVGDGRIIGATGVTSEDDTIFTFGS